MVKVRQNLLPSSLYSWKSPYKMKPTRIVVHNTYNDASADAEIRYMHKTEAQGGRQTSYHYAVDDKEAVQGLPENRNGWHSGDGNGKGNREGIGIEICYSLSGGDRFIKAEQNAVELIVDILKRYGWGIDKVTKHQDYANKYCPHRTLDMGWDRFINMIKDKLEDKPVAEKVKGTITVREGTWNVREGAGTQYKVVRIARGGEQYPYYDIVNGWYKLSDGYISSTGVEGLSTTKYYKKCAKKYTSIVDALKSIGVDSSYSNRHKIATKNGIKAYVGLPSQNIRMLNLLKAGTLKKV
jgi:N-acetylmuramoyl-L-alanine amidase CwlA